MVDWDDLPKRNPLCLMDGAHIEPEEFVLICSKKTADFLCSQQEG